MPHLKYIPIPAFSDNYIWLVTDGHAAVVVDPGDAKPVNAFCGSQAIKISAILLTHHHADHIGGVEELLEGPNTAAEIAVFGPTAEQLQHVTRHVSQGDHVEVPALNFHAHVMEVPAHTAGHIAYFQPPQSGDAPHLFSGDALFASGCGRLFEGTAVQLLSSMDAFSGLDDATFVHCAHEYTLSNIAFSRAVEPANLDIVRWEKDALALRAAGRPTLPTTIGHEKRVNPFMRVRTSTVRAGLSEHLGGLFEPGVVHPVAAIALLRRWKDSFAAPPSLR